MARLSDLIKYLNENNVPHLVLRHSPAFSAHEVAAATHVPDSVLAKTVVLHIDGKYWLAVLRADHRIDEKRVKRSFGAEHVHLAREEELASLFPDCEVGAMPPFGNLYALPTVVDRSLAEDEEIVFNACTHTESVRLKFKDYIRLAHPLIGDLASVPHTL
jgi:Ala-tRNA(Pro) deacylase